MSFDRLGPIPLDRCGPLDKDHQRIREDIRNWELGQATRNAPSKLLRGFNDFHAAWLLVQAARLRGTIDGTIRDLKTLIAQDTRTRTGGCS